MWFNPIRSYRARLFRLQPVLPVAVTNGTPSFKQESHYQTLKKLEHILDTLNRYETKTVVPASIQAAHSARQCIEMPRELLKAEAFLWPVSTSRAYDEAHPTDVSKYHQVVPCP